MNEFDALLIFVVLLMILSLPLMMWAGKDGGFTEEQVKRFLENDDER